MRIAYFTETFLPKVDGVVNTLCNLLRYLPTKGHESLLFAPQAGGTPDHYANTRVITQPGMPCPLYPEIKLVSPTIDVTEELERFKPDVVHVLHPISLGMAGMWQARYLGIPVVASYHTDLVAYARYFGLGFLSDFAVRVERWIHNQADLNLCPSTATMNELEGYGFERLKIWTRGVDTQLFHPGRRRSDMREWLSGGEPDKPLLLYVGRVSHEKRVDWLRRLLDRLQSNGHDVRLAIVGDGPARAEFEQYFADTPTVFTGILRGEELAAAYASADMFAFPSATETLGNVVLEANAAGLPAVCAAAGGPVDLVKDGENGYLFAAHDEALFHDAVERLLASNDFIRRMSKLARARAEQRSWSAVHDLLIQDYAEIAGVPLLKQAI